MKPAPFEYVRARSVAEACEWLARDGDGAKLIAGGQSLVPMMAMRLTRPRRLVDIGEVPELGFITVEDDAIRIGACARQCTIERDDALAARLPLLRQALVWVGHTQTRNRGTLGGSLAHADPAAELPLVARVLGATMLLRSASGARAVAASDFFTGPLTTAARPDECLEEVRWPLRPGDRCGSAFSEVSRRHGDFAIVAAAAQVTLGEDGRCAHASFGLGGGVSVPQVFPEVAAPLVGSRLEQAAVTGAAQDAAARFDAGGDLHASAAYRRHLAAVLVARVLCAARDDAKSKTSHGNTRKGKC